MSEYWKSTPKYWCKFCSTFVRDTPLEKKQHEATGKHQNNISKSLRDLYKTQSREDHEKQKAKDEVARLNGLVGGKAGSSKQGSAAHPPVATVAKAKPHFTGTQAPRETAEDRRRQAEQLVAMGVAVPDAYRKDMALASEWSTVAVTPVYPRATVRSEEVKNEDSDEYDEDKKIISALDRQRKRKLDVTSKDATEGDADLARPAKKVWGSTVKEYPGVKKDDAEDFDALLSATVVKKEVKRGSEVLEDGIKIKHEESTDDVAAAPDVATNTTDAANAPVVFRSARARDEHEYLGAMKRERHTHDLELR